MYVTHNETGKENTRDCCVLYLIQLSMPCAQCRIKGCARGTAAPASQ